jgi:Flp pilus assembly protein TadG
MLRDEGGQVAVLVVVMALGLMAMAGLVADGGSLFAARRNLQALADGAARAGAMAIDVGEFRSSGGTVVRLDPAAARRRAEAYLGTTGFGGSAQVEADQQTVTVRVMEQQSTTFLLRVVGVRSPWVSATSTARPRHGIESEVG